MNERRFEKIKHVAHQRQGNLTVVLENVHDSHNIGAVLRTCDAVGIKEVFLLYTEPRHLKKKLTIGKRTSMGTRKWVDTLFYTDADACFKDVKQKYDLVLATHLDEYSKSLFEIDFNQSLALVFGNEAKGITPITMKHVDGSFNIPQMGMVESLNISVACAVTLYEVLRQRLHQDGYANNNTTSAVEKDLIFQEYLERAKNKVSPIYLHKKS